MKTVENKVTTIVEDESKKPVKYMTYFDLFLISVKHVNRSEGIQVEKMVDKIRVIIALKGATDKVELEDADFDTLKRCFSEMPWGMVSEEIVAASAYLAGLAK